MSADILDDELKKKIKDLENKIDGARRKIDSSTFYKSDLDFSTRWDLDSAKRDLEDAKRDLKKFRGDESCLIATAAMFTIGETNNDEALLKLKWFRDKVLMESNEGRELINSYYECAYPIIAKLESLSDYRKIMKNVYRYVKMGSEAVEKRDFTKALDLAKEVLNTIRLSLRYETIE